MNTDAKTLRFFGTGYGKRWALMRMERGMNEEQNSNEVTFVKHRTRQYSDTVWDVLNTFVEQSRVVEAKDVIALYSVIAKLGIGAQRIHNIVADLRRERRPPDAAERGAFHRYFDLVDELDEILKALNIAILDAYRPGLAARFAEVKWGDEDVYHLFEELAPEFSIDRRVMPDSLKRILYDWWYDSLRPSALLSSPISRSFEPATPSNESLQILETLSNEMKNLAEDIGTMIRENWSLAEIAEAGKPTLRVQVGDYFANIGAGAVIVNRSSLNNALNRVGTETNDRGVLWALESVAEKAERSGNEAAIELFNAMTEELERPKHRKAVLRSTWENLTKLLVLNPPHISMSRLRSCSIEVGNASYESQSGCSMSRARVSSVGEL
jgi:hypothetical protein